METQPYPAAQPTSPDEPKHKKRRLIISVFVVVLGVLIIAAAAGAYWYFSKSKPVACTEEAKICPDGSFVGRAGPNCEFAECPSGTNDGQNCIQVITPAKNLATGECKEFGNPCIVPEGWVKVDSCSIYSPSALPVISGWQIYRNDKAGIEFNYPTGWIKLIENQPADKMLSVVVVNKKENPEVRFEAFLNYGVGFENLSFIRNESKINFCNVSVNKQLFTDTDIFAYMVQFNTNDPYGDDYSLYFEAPKENWSNYSVIFDQIVSTFKCKNL